MNEELQFLDVKKINACISVETCAIWRVVDNIEQFLRMAWIGKVSRVIESAKMEVLYRAAAVEDMYQARNQIQHKTGMPGHIE